MDLYFNLDSVSFYFFIEGSSDKGACAFILDVKFFVENWSSLKQTDDEINYFCSFLGQKSFMIAHRLFFLVFEGIIELGKGNFDEFSRLNR